MSNEPSDWTDAPVNFQRVLEVVNNRIDVLRELVDLFTEEAVTTLAKLKQAVEAKNYREVQLLAHRLGGASANFGIDSVIGPLQIMEQQAKESVIDNATVDLAKIEADIKVALAFLQSKC